MEFPENVLSVVKDAAAKHREDPQKATDAAVATIRELPEFDELAVGLVRHAVLELVYDVRHRANGQIKRETGGYGQPAKVNGVSPGTLSAHQSAYHYHIAGTVLGFIKGADLDGIMESEQAIAAGHRFNVELCRALKELVPEDQRVKDAVPEKKLRAIFRRLQEEVGVPELVAAGH